MFLAILYGTFLTSTVSANEGDSKLLDGVAFSPGKYWGQDGSGVEASLLYFKNDFGAFSAIGLASGIENGRLTYSEFEAGGTGWLLIGFFAGVGAYFPENEPAKFQGTLSLQVLPLFFYGRWRGEEKKPEVGMMVKFPIHYGRKMDREGNFSWEFGAN
jgi:hypothetical protein